MNKKLLGIDAIKTLATVLVVFYHYAYSKLDFGYNTETLIFKPTVEWALMNVVSICVPLFFMSSGFCNLSSESFNWKKAIKKTCSIGILTCIWNYFLPFEYWFFISLALLYISTPIIKLLKSKSHKIFYAIVGIVFLATFIKNEIYVILCYLNIDSPLSISGLFTSYSLIYYFLGDTSKHIQISKFKLFIIFIIGFLLSIYDGVILTVKQEHVFDGVNSAFCMLSTLFMTWSIFMLIKGFDSNNQPIRTILYSIAGGCLPIYLFHSSIIRYLNTHTSLSIYCEHNIFLLLLISIAICVFCWAIGKLITKTPYIKLLLKL